MESQRRQFQLNVPGLLKVLAENLYSSRRVAIRELIQNGHDSIIRRKFDEQDAGYEPRIRISTDPARGVIRIDDNGAGMTDDDIVNYLTTIGNSYTREVGANLEILHPEQAGALIGQFGLGFLSAFLVASDVTLLTRAKNSDQGWRWHCDASEYYEMAPVDYQTVGTAIELKLKPEAEFLLEEADLTHAIRRYADFLTIPIYLNEGETPVNLMSPPWDAEDQVAAAKTYIERMFRQQSPIHILPIQDQTVDLGHDTLVIPMKGFVFIPPTSVVSVGEFGDLIVYIRSMFITDHERDLLPSWAKFFRGVVECPTLQPTASRESIHQEETFLAVQQALEAQLLAELRRLAKDEPRIWHQIVSNHTDLVLGWVTINSEFFDQVADLLPLQTSRGPMVLPEYLKQTDNTIYFVTQQIGSLQEQLLGEGFEVPVIDASWFAVRPFLERYATRRETGVRLVQMDGDARRLMRLVDDERFAGLLAFFKQRGVAARTAEFKPESVPALMLYPRNANSLLEARRALDSNELSTPFAAMISDYLDQQSDDVDAKPTGVLYLNTSCALIRQMAAPEVPPPQRDAVLTLVHQVARLFAGRTLTAKDASQAFSDVCQSVQEMLSHD